MLRIALFQAVLAHQLAFLTVLDIVQNNPAKLALSKIMKACQGQDAGPLCVAVIRAMGY